MNRRWLALLLIILLTLPLAGCWETRDPRRRAYVLGISIDPDPAGGDNLLVSVQLPIPGQARAPSTGGGGGGGGDQPEFYLARGVGPTVMDAFAEAQDKISRELFFGQMRAVILSSELSEEQMRRAITAIWNVPDIEETVYVLQARGRADTVLGQPIKLERLPALYFNNVFEAVRRLTVSQPVQMWEYWRVVSTSGWDPVLPSVEITPEGVPEIDGLGLFQDHQPVGRFDREEAKGYLWMMGRTRGATVATRTSTGVASARQLDVSRSVTMRFEGGKPVFQVDLKVTGQVDLIAHRRQNEQELEELGDAVEQEIQRQVRAAIAKAKEHRTDPFGFGKVLYYRYPHYYDRVDWRELFPTVTVETTVEVNLVRKGALD